MFDLEAFILLTQNNLDYYVRLSGCRRLVGICWHVWGDHPIFLFVQRGKFRLQVLRKRPEFPSGLILGIRTTMSSWFMKRKRKREQDAAFAGFDLYRKSGGLRN